jgi:hypothetical protein
MLRSVVVKAVGGQKRSDLSVNLQTLQIYSILHITESNPLRLFKGQTELHRALLRQLISGLSSHLCPPRILYKGATSKGANHQILYCGPTFPKRFIDSIPDKIEEFEEKSDKGRADMLSLATRNPGTDAAGGDRGLLATGTK